MTMENPGQQKTGPAADTVQQPVATAVPNPSRRRFTRAGVGASAVVLTLASRSVLADTLCKSPSGFDSLKPSTDTNQGAVCAGKTADQWLLQDPWPVSKDTSFASIFGNGYDGLYAGAPPATSTAARVAAVPTSTNKWFDPFNEGSKAGKTDGKAQAGTATAATTTAATTTTIPNPATANSELLLKDATVFQAMSGSRTPLVVKNLLAAWLNARGKYSAFPTETDVVQIFQELQQKGYYEVRATVKWYEADINKYLASTNSLG